MDMYVEYPKLWWIVETNFKQLLYAALFFILFVLDF
jgi:hypothetical protein